MTPGARIQAAIEVLGDIVGRHRPIGEALADWGKSHRFAGSGDRNAIGGLVYDAMRSRSSIAWRFEDESARSLALGAAPSALGLEPERVIAVCDSTGHTPVPLDERERTALTRSTDAAPDHIRADVPLWLWPHFEASFGAHAIEEGRRLAERAPTDLRVNTLKSDRERVLKALLPFNAVPTPHSPIGVRIAAPVATARTPNLQAEAAFQAGWFEIQDEGSQIASLLSGLKPGLQVMDLCAGGGGKTLALAAELKNSGQLYAYDSDRLRLQPIFDRIKRAGARGVQVLRGGDIDAVRQLGPRFDVVLVDAPCTGTGVWRRRPDAKWRLKPESLVNRMEEQDLVLALACPLVKPGGLLVYVTCSLIEDENWGRVSRFLETAPEFTLEPSGTQWRTRSGIDLPPSADGREHGLVLTPRAHGTDGFYIAALRRAA